MHILFICTGNVSRSTVAECILRTMAEREGRNDISVASAGVHDLFGHLLYSIVVKKILKLLSHVNDLYLNPHWIVFPETYW